MLYPVPVLSPALSARWIHLVTPVPSAIALPLTEGLSVPTVCRENRIDRIVRTERISCRKAIRTALDQILEKQVDTCWSDAGWLQPPEWAICGDAEYAGGTILNCAYVSTINAPPEQVWRAIANIGGANGYYYANWLWCLRGILDKLTGGVGLRRGRRHPSELMAGDALDFWRVISVQPSRRLTLMAEMRVPGDAILDIQIIPQKHNRSEMRLISRFLPKGLAGIVYWYSLYPLHVLIFKGMLKAIARKTGAGGTVRSYKLRAKPPADCVIERDQGNPLDPR